MKGIIDESKQSLVRALDTYFANQSRNEPCGCKKFDSLEIGEVINEKFDDLKQRILENLDNKKWKRLTKNEAVDEIIKDLLGDSDDA